jgi:hypothetical protein
MNPSHSISLRSILITFYHIHQGLPKDLFSSGFKTIILFAFPILPFVLHASLILHSFSEAGYLMTLSVSTLYNTDDKTINECRTADGMRIGRGNRSSLRKPAPTQL